MSTISCPHRPSPPSPPRPSYCCVHMYSTGIGICLWARWPIAWRLPWPLWHQTLQWLNWPCSLAAALCMPSCSSSAPVMMMPLQVSCLPTLLTNSILSTLSPSLTHDQNSQTCLSTTVGLIALLDLTPVPTAGQHRLRSMMPHTAAVADCSCDTSACCNQ